MNKNWFNQTMVACARVDNDNVAKSGAITSPKTVFPLKHILLSTCIVDG